ncbi:MAG: hypothetical protein IH945_04520 [Armatimonadetes bacterium]|nr:hypothetical protein [Armatimonadota bacterium]
MRQNVFDLTGPMPAKTVGSRMPTSLKAFRRRGVTSVMVLLMMFVALTVMLSLAGMSMGSIKRSSNEKNSMLALNVAQTTLEYEVANAYERAKLNNGDFEYVFTDHTVLAQSLTPGALAVTFVEPQGNGSFAWVTSYSLHNNKLRSVRHLVKSHDVSIWNNAVFAGTGAQGNAINGNVDIRGSIHILGEGEPYSDLNGNGQWDDAEVFQDDNGNGVWDPGEPWVDTNNDGVWNSAEPFNDTNWNGVYDPPITTTELSSSFAGSALIGNNYSGMPLELENMVPPPPIINGQETLEAEVRVKHGQISLNGTATVGQDFDPDGGTSKGQIDGSFVNDGYTGNQGSSSVYSDNGFNQGYDLNNLDISFPFINGIGAEPYIDQNNVAWSTQELFLDTNSMTVPVNEITNSTSAFDYSDLQGNRMAFIPKNQVSPVDGSVSANDRMYLNGIIKIDGDLTFTKKLGELRYSGNGTIYATGDINVSTNLLPAAGLTFPTDTTLGLIAERDMNLAMGPGDSQLSMAGAFYAQGTVRSKKQNQIAGTFVANYFDMGNNVPNIYQVPALVNNMPPGMPGNERFFTLKVRSWRERKFNFVFGS